jgi:lipid A disaccharide synthetase
VRPLINVRYITLVNLLASQQPFGPTSPPGEQPLYPEYPTWRDCSEQIARHAIEWLSDERSRQRLISRLTDLRERIAAGGASATAADYIVRQLGAASADVLSLPAPSRTVLRKAS